MEASYIEKRDWIEEGKDFHFLFILQSILSLTLCFCLSSLE
jgi:hypothetical protein